MWRTENKTDPGRDGCILSFIWVEKCPLPRRDSGESFDVLQVGCGHHGKSPEQFGAFRSPSVGIVGARPESTFFNSLVLL